MTTTEAVKRAKDKLTRGEVICEIDVMNLVNSVWGSAYNEGRRSAFDQLKEYLDRVSS